MQSVVFQNLEVSKNIQCIYGESGSGKSVYARHLAKKYINEGKNTLFVDGLFNDYKKIDSQELLKRNKNADIFFSNYPNLTISSIESFLSKIQRNNYLNDKDIVFVDHFELDVESQQKIINTINTYLEETSPTFILIKTDVLSQEDFESVNK